eukprot:XP_006374608.2 uncharacterized protein LOC18105893 isoform X2 [Populus trichocarpa]
MIHEVWVEMVAYAAAHCPWKEHTKELRRGGELLTHVSLLMLHLGLSAQYEENESEYYLELRGEEEEEEYVEGIAAMSGSSPDEELKKLEKIVADTKRKLERVKQEHEHQQRKLEREERKLEREERKLQRQLERKNQELEQLRSSLTVSAPQQGIDSLPRSLPAQTDGQGTGQPPSNNEISLSME